MTVKLSSRLIIFSITGAVGFVSILTVVWAIFQWREAQFIEPANEQNQRKINLFDRELTPKLLSGSFNSSQLAFLQKKFHTFQGEAVSIPDLNDGKSDSKTNPNLINPNNANSNPNSITSSSSSSSATVSSNAQFSYFISQLNLLERNQKIETQLDRSRVQINNLLNTLPKLDESKLPKNKKCNHQGKVFAIGLMKTGTTSIVKALNRLGYPCWSDSCLHVGNWKYPNLPDAVLLWQPQEIIINSIFNISDARKKYIDVSSKAMSFGDSPWCFLWPVWDVLYPGSKFILMERDSLQTYVKSYINYLQSFGKHYVTDGLKSSEFAMLAARRYDMHNARVIEYFKDRPDDLLVWNINDPATQKNPWKAISEFLGCPEPNFAFPHLNSGGSGKKKKPATYLDEYPDMNWREYFGEGMIPYVHRDKGKDALHLHVVKESEFETEFCC